MLSEKTANLVFVVLLLVACAVFAWMAQGFETSGLLASSGLPSKFFPQLTLALTAICALLVGWSYFRQPAAVEGEEDTIFENGAEAGQGLLMLLVTVGCYLVWRNFGFLPMAILLGPCSLLAMGVRNPMLFAVVWALTAIVTALFVYGLKIPLL